ncbi:MAG TPA: hypothetical protein VGJ21_18105 [Terracidiphilus sp.]|jgi:hypothetical protein
MRRLSLGLVTLAAAGAVVLVAQSKLADFGLNPNQIKPNLVESFRGGYLPAYPDRKAYHAASTAARVAFVKDTLAWVKAFTESPAFKADYEKKRDEGRPSAPEAKGSADDQYSKMLADQKKSMEQMKKQISQMSPDMQKQMQPVLQQMQAAIDKSANDPQMAASMKSAIAQGAQNEGARHQEDLAKYDKEFPADPRLLIALRLHEFLDETKDLDFNAKLVGTGGSMRFASPAFESKSDRWKLCFRAGKEPTEAARAFATDWLGQLEGK